MFVDVLFEDILMAPSATSSKVQPTNVQTIQRDNSSDSLESIDSNDLSAAVMRTVKTTIFLSQMRQKREVPQETVEAHRRATKLASKTISRLASERRLSRIAADTTGDNSIAAIADILLKQFAVEILRQRRVLGRREQLAFDAAWRYFSFLEDDFKMYFGMLIRFVCLCGRLKAGGVLGEREKELIRDRMISVRVHSAFVASKLRQSEDEQEVGIELFHAWVIDLLGMRLSLPLL